MTSLIGIFCHTIIYNHPIESMYSNIVELICITTHQSISFCTKLIILEKNIDFQPDIRKILFTKVYYGICSMIKV